jgi:hypothetical protein
MEISASGNAPSASSDTDRLKIARLVIVASRNRSRSASRIHNTSRQRNGGNRNSKLQAVIENRAAAKSMAYANCMRKSKTACRNRTSKRQSKSHVENANRKQSQAEKEMLVDVAIGEAEGVG